MKERNRRALSRPAALLLFNQAPPRLRLLVLTMLLFNAGFYLVLPFLAHHLVDDLGLAAGLVGALLGARMLFQQGLFVVGGLAADRWGARRTILAGIALRVVSFLLLAGASEVPLLVTAVLLLGAAGALFTPAVEALIATEAAQLAEQGGPSRTQTFALYAACGELGTVLGPALGSLLLLGGFSWCCLVAAGIFALTYLAHHRMLPRNGASRSLPTLSDTPSRAPDQSWAGLLRKRRFVFFAIAFSGYLALFNQLYLAVPLELARTGHPAAVAGWFFTASALLVVLLQLRLSSAAWLADRADRAVPAGFLLMGLGALAPALAAPTGGTIRLIALTAFVLLLTLGQMLLLPASRDAVARLAREQRLATHFGLVGTAGGIAVLATSAAVGWAFDASIDTSVSESLPWWLLVPVALASALATRAALSTPLVRDVPRPAQPATTTPVR